MGSRTDWNRTRFMRSTARGLASCTENMKNRRSGSYQAPAIVAVKWRLWKLTRPEDRTAGQSPLTPFNCRYRKEPRFSTRGTVGSR